MSIIKDDPREVLAILNSFGFVGITSPQLKAFLKDLKLFRKLKERERQQKKEEIRKKIIGKHQNMVREVLREQNQDEKTSFTESPLSSDSSDFYPDDSVVKVRVRCFRDNKGKDDQDVRQNFIHTEKNTCLQKAVHRESSLPISNQSNNARVENDAGQSLIKHLRREKTTPEHTGQKVHLEENTRQPRRASRIGNGHHEKELTKERPASATESTTGRSESRHRTRARSVSGTRSSARSGTKSFIRPWRLQPEVQSSGVMKRSDPVTLYQKYQQEWNRISFPGEAKRTSVRWAVREKMLGSDPRPMPIPKTSCAPILKRK